MKRGGFFFDEGASIVVRTLSRTAVSRPSISLISSRPIVGGSGLFFDGSMDVAIGGPSGFCAFYQCGPFVLNFLGSSHVCIFNHRKEVSVNCVRLAGFCVFDGRFPHFLAVGF